MITIQGKGVSAGIGMGPLYFHRRAKTKISRYTVTDTQAEWLRFKDARSVAMDQLDKSKILGFVTSFGSSSSHTAILAIGVDELSVTPGAVLPRRNKIRSLDVDAARECILAEIDGDASPKFQYHALLTLPRPPAVQGAAVIYKFFCYEVI